MGDDAHRPFHCPSQECQLDQGDLDFGDAKRFYLHWFSTHKPRCPRTDCKYSLQDLSKSTESYFCGIGLPISRTSTQARALVASAVENSPIRTIETGMLPNVKAIPPMPIEQSQKQLPMILKRTSSQISLNMRPQILVLKIGPRLMPSGILSTISPTMQGRHILESTCPRGHG